MRKGAVLLSLALALALALPAYADVQITGELKGNFKYNLLEEENPLSTEAEAKTSLKLTSSNARGEINLSLNGAKRALGAPALNQNITPKLESAWLEVDGAYYEGLPSVTTKIGRFWEVIDPWVASFGYKEGQPGVAEGVKLSGISAGPVDVVGFVGWFAEYHNDYKANRLAGVSLSGNLDIADVRATYVAVDGTTLSSNDYAVSATVNPADGVKLTGAFANNGANEATAIKVGGEFQVIDNVTLKGSYWTYDDGFNPAFPKRKDDKPGEKPTEFTAGGDEKGFEVGASTKQFGADLSATYKATTDVDGNNEKNTVKLTASRNFDLPVLEGFKASLETEFNLSDDDADPAITAKTEFTVAKIKVKTESKLHDEFHKIETEYTAPNTIKLKSKFEFKEGETSTSELVAEYSLKF